MKKEEIIRRHFHGFSDEQWNLLKGQFPYCEIPYILNDFEREAKCTLPVVSGPLPLASDIKIALKDGIKTRTYQKRYNIPCDFPQEKVEQMIDEIIDEMFIRASESNDH